MKRLKTIAAALLFAIEGASAGPALSVNISGSPETVIEWRSSHCAPNDYPDTPLRAVRLDDGSVVAFASHFENRRLLGSSLERLHQDCQVVFRGAEDERPEVYSDRVWIASTWSDGGRTIFALGHDEYQAHRHPGRCRFAGYVECWWNAIVPLRSDDGGATFAKVGEPPVASIPDRQDVGQGRNRGFFEPSNIVEFEGAHYAFVRTGAYGPQKAGTCLLRTVDLSRPEAWRLFDGRSFRNNVDPYRDDVANSDPCATLEGLKGVVGSVVFVAAQRVFLAVSSFASSPDDSGFYVSTSRDLINWSESTRFLKAPTPWSGVCGADRFAYPAILDPSSASRNFDVVDGAPYLYFVRQKMRGCDVSDERDLMRVRLAIHAPAGD